ncbi:MAG: tetratricopeptide repeat protein [Rhodothermia bacterium]|nr:tetratricopeptide repeat protein [Rhodothermia bacterium]
MSRRRKYVRLPANQRRLVSIVLAGYVLLIVNSIILLIFERSTAFAYMTNVLLHVGLGVVLVVPVLAFLALHLSKMPFHLNRTATLAGAFTALSLGVLLATGFGIVILGASFGGGWLLDTHIVTAVVTVLAFVGHVSLKEGARYHFLEWGDAWRAGFSKAARHPFGMTLAAGLGISMLLLLLPLTRSEPVYVEGGGEAHGMAEAQAVLAHDGFLEQDDLARSETCGQEGCHPDVFAQWSESVHRFSSFNNPYYAKTVDLMLERSGSQPTRWCASCHDPVVLFSGGFGNEQPVDTTHWTAHEGITCLSCHAVRGLRDLRGNGRYVIARPDEYPFARASGAAPEYVHDKLIQIKPEPHRDAMLRPVHRDGAFCGTCHKVGLPPEVNNYRWKRGQNEWDAWHASGTSGNTVRSFYLPDKTQTCVSCHMPLVPSDDRGNEDGLIRSHRFASANSALPHLSGHAEQLQEVEDALQDSIATVDIFQVRVGGRSYGPDQPMPALRPGARVEVDVVVRNRKVGHMLPGGTNDSNELWLELRAESDNGKPVLGSGLLDAHGRVDSTAHFWGAVLVDRASQLIDKRNAQDWVATVYAHTIAPGTAHLVHYRFTVPAGAPVQQLTATLQHRKFKWYYHNWVFRGYPAGDQPDSLVSAAVDQREWLLDDREAPSIPVIGLATATRAAGEQVKSNRPLWERWNDLGIGYLVEGDTRAALRSFERVAELAPDSPEGPINMARVLLSEGQLDRALKFLQEAERRRPGFLKTAYFRGVYHQAVADYEATLADWMRVYAAYPADRVLLRGIGRVHYLAGRYDQAVDWFDRVLQIDPEDVDGLYNRMLALGAAGRDAEFAEARQTYLYHKEDENAMAVTTPYKQANPTDNRESQIIHEHGLSPVRFD